MNAATILASIFEQAFEDTETRAAARNLQLLCEAGEWCPDLILRSIAAAVDPASEARPLAASARSGSSRSALDDLADPHRRPPASEELSGVERLLDFLSALRGAGRELAASLRAAAGSQQRLAGQALHSPTAEGLRRRVEELAVASERTRIAIEAQLIVERFLAIAAKRIEAALLEASGAQGAFHEDVYVAERPPREQR